MITSGCYDLVAPVVIPIVTIINIIAVLTILDTGRLATRLLARFGNDDSTVCKHLRGHNSSAIVAAILYGLNSYIFYSCDGMSLIFSESPLGYLWLGWYCLLNIAVIGILMHMNKEMRLGFILR